MAPAARTVRAYAAPVNRRTGATIVFDPATMGGFDPDAPPQPWIDLGWVENFRRAAATKYEALAHRAELEHHGAVSHAA